MTGRRRVLSLIAAALLLTGLHALPLQAQEGAQWRIRYSELSRLPAAAADKMSADDIDAIAAEKVRAEAKTNPGARIAAGTDAMLGNFHEVVRLQFSDREGEHLCTGVLISNDAILTAGHCGCGSNYRAEFQNAPVENDSQNTFVPLTVSAGPFPFPGYDCRNASGTQIGRDLALLRIVPFPYDGQYATFSVADEDWDLLLDFPVIRSSVQVLSRDDLRSLYIVGFGRTESGLLARNLQGANVGLISRNCQRGRVFGSYCAMFREFALGRSSSDPGSQPADSCGGDSGGPAYRMDTDAQLSINAGRLTFASHRTLVGIVSRALNGVVHPYPGYCGGGGIYTAVGTRPVLDWLRSQNVKLSFDPNPLYQ